MPSRRDLIRMTPDEIHAYLLVQRRMIVVTTNENGMPHLMPMNFGIDEQNRVLINTFAKSQKVKNLERDPRATLLVESGTAYDELRSVIHYADAEFIYDQDEMARLRPLIQADNGISIEPGSTKSEQIRASMVKRVIIRFTPFRTISWDHAKLAGHY